MLRLVILVLVSIAFAPQEVFACSFARGYQPFAASAATGSDGSPPPVTPGVSVRSLRRGFDDGNYASCSDAGILTIAIDDAETAKDLGFIFELESGAFPDEVLPEGVVSPVELGDGSSGFFFVWLDLPSGNSTVAPIDVRVSVRAVSPTMAEGDKMYFDVKDP